MKWMVYNIRRFAPERVDIHDLVEKSWKDVENAFGKVTQQLAEISIEDLSRVGLSGPQLELKLKEYEYRREKFDKAARLLEEGYERRKPARVIRKLEKNTKKQVSKTCEITNIILESLSALIMPAHILKEIKGVLRGFYSK